MATGNTILPIDDEQLRTVRAWYVSQGENVYVPENLRHGRFPSENELRRAVQALGFQIDERADWYVSSDNDFTEIWFKSSAGEGDQPVEFWCRRGSIIVLDIMQSLANGCGSFFVIHHSDGDPVLVVPDDTFLDVPPPASQQGYFATISHRAPHLITRLLVASVDDVLFVLTQFQHALHKAYQPNQRHELLEVLRPGLSAYSSLSTHSDTRVSRLARELVTVFQDGSDGPE